VSSVQVACRVLDIKPFDPSTPSFYRPTLPTPNLLESTMAEPKRKDLTLTTLQKVAILSDAAYLSSRPLPTAPDGQYDWQETPDAMMRPEGHSGLTNVLNKVCPVLRVSGGCGSAGTNDATLQVATLQQKGLVAPDPKIIGAFIDGAINDGAEDDRKGAFAAGLTILSRLPEGTDAKTTMSDKAITMLYNSLPHPPAALLGPAHTFRQADGGGNNLQYPDLGRAGMPYARSVQGKWSLPVEKLPDPGLVFDCLLRRRKVSLSWEVLCCRSLFTDTMSLGYPTSGRELCPYFRLCLARDPQLVPNGFQGLE
jgi:hypothetical protein